MLKPFLDVSHYGQEKCITSNEKVVVSPKQIKLNFLTEDKYMPKNYLKEGK